MPGIRSSTRAIARTAFLAGAAVIALAGCSLVGASAPAIVGTAPLVTVTTRGGECPEGPCGSSVVIERDGTVHLATKPPNAVGTVPSEVLAALDAAIKTTDFDLVRAVPFDGECPTAYDGQETIYEFGAPGGTQRVASCESRIDPAHPVFAATSAALVGVGLSATP